MLMFSEKSNNGLRLLIASTILAFMAGCDTDPQGGDQVQSQVTSPAPDAECADIYLSNGRFFSMSELPQQTDDGALSDFNSLRISGNVIADVGDDLVAPECARTIDLDGRTVVPGLVDSHMHFVRATLRPGYSPIQARL